MQIAAVAYISVYMSSHPVGTVCTSDELLVTNGQLGPPLPLCWLISDCRQMTTVHMLSSGDLQFGDCAHVEQR